MNTLPTDDSTQFSVATPTEVLGRLFVRFPDCNATDEVLLVPVTLTMRQCVLVDAFQWVCAGNPAIPASDPFQSESQAWEFAWLAWEEQPLPSKYRSRRDRGSL